MQHVGQDVIELVVPVAWCIWYNCNKARHGSPRQSTNEILHKAHTTLEDFQATHFKLPQLTSPSDARWVPPSYPWFKINTDAALFNDLGTVDISAIIRDHEGEVIVALSQHLQLPLGPLEAEAKALDLAVLFAWDIGIRDVIFETDSNMVFTILSGSTTPPATIVDVMESIQLKLHDFRYSQVQHVRRQGNKLAHALAQHARDKRAVIPNFGLVNQLSLDEILKAEVFVPSDSQLRAAHLILGYTPISKGF
ncbi:uncharacterized protein LOC142631245 [Castanea sativa]|uniref:uncharacterized protein LOC142631245 n=1 Tax=Castanea sativa TaxID=21020 RepID=UPI003F64A8E2